MKIIFIGSVLFSKIVLQNLLNKHIKISGIISLKKKVYLKSDYFNLSITAKEKGIDILEVNKINTKSTKNWVKQIQPDLIICLGWSEIIDEELLGIPKIGIIGYHPSKLPENRGKHPIIWSIALGLKETASTFFIMDKKIDNGKILSQKKIKIDNFDDATSLYKKLTKVASNQLFELLKKLNKPIFKNIYKKNNYNYWRSRSFIDGEINWTSSSITIHNLVRSLTYPYPNAHFIYKKKIIKVLKTKLGKTNKINLEPGKVINNKNGTFEIKCGQLSIYLLECNPKIKLKLGEYL